MANTLLAAHIPRSRPLDRARLAPGARSRARGDAGLTRMLEHLATKLPLTVALLALALLALGLLAGLLALAVKGIAGLGEPAYVGPVRTGILSGIGFALFAAPVAILTIAGLVAAGQALRRLIRTLLIAPQTVEGGPVRELLAESLGDRTLSIAYWLPDREIFVDDAGPSRPPARPGSGRAWTAVERDGKRVAAILHDAELDTGPELVQAAAAAAALALDNERLKADLRARVEELRVSRVRIVQAGDAARRRIERDLHDGAQQQLVSLALDLRLLKARLRDAEAARWSTSWPRSSTWRSRSCASWPAASTPWCSPPRGWAPRCAPWPRGRRCPSRSTSSSGEDERLSAPIEAAAYFLVAEALTNVVRYAQASEARVTVRREPELVVVEVHDDGIGGADMAAGTGLRGLADRIAALEGTLRVHSPAGKGTHVEARIPCGAGALVGRRHRPGSLGHRLGHRAAGRPGDAMTARSDHGGAVAGAAERAPPLRPRARRRRRVALLLALDGLRGGPGGAPARPRRGRRHARAPTAPSPRRPARRADSVRISVVTHGQASSSFWVVVRNGIDAAARQVDASVTYRSPDTYSVERMSALIDAAVATRPDGLVVTIPSAAWRPRSAARSPRASRSCRSTPARAASASSGSSPTSASPRSARAREPASAWSARASAAACASTTRPATPAWPCAAARSRAPCAAPGAAPRSSSSTSRIARAPASAWRPSSARAGSRGC
jgi:signal transduction histidine kinase